MKNLLLLSFLCCAQILLAQTFTDITPDSPFRDYVAEVSAFSDIDGDGDIDILTSGHSTSAYAASKLFFNDGNGNFIEKPNTPFKQLRLSAISFIDTDNDGDEDVIAINTLMDPHIPEIYENLGNGNFAKVSNTPFEEARFGKTALSDFNGDGYKDVIIIGSILNVGEFAKLYHNDGEGNFIKVYEFPFEAWEINSFALADVNNDQYDDIIIAGRGFGNEFFTKLYTYNGEGSFTEVLNTPFEAMEHGKIVVTDIDEDDYNDLLIMRENDVNQVSAQLYLNDGMGNFTVMDNFPFDEFKKGTGAFIDINDDGIKDLLIIGSKLVNSWINKAYIYTNDGNGNLTETDSFAFDQSAFIVSLELLDLNGDGLEDMFITENKSPVLSETRLYINNGNGNFVDRNRLPIGEVGYSNMAFADVNGDEHEDVIITGRNRLGLRTVRLYINNGNGSFIEKTDVPFHQVERGGIAFSDIDEDGDEDVLISGITPDGIRLTNLYLNDGDGNFTEEQETPFVNLAYGAAIFSDLNGDSHEDLLIAGQTDGGERITRMYTNDGNGHFTEQTNTPFAGVFMCSIEVADVNGDDAQDVLITGRSQSSGSIARLYTNDGGGHFTELASASFEGVGNGAGKFSDVNGDGHQDILIIGAGSWGASARLYLNDGSANFEEVEDIPFEGASYGSVAFSDVNADNFEDVIISGRNVDFGQSTFLYLNDGTGNFSKSNEASFEGVEESSVGFSDVNGDGFPDILLTGINSINGHRAKIYLNDGIEQNVIDTTSIEELAFSIHPNPVRVTNYWVNIQIESEKERTVHMDILDMSGRLHRQLELELVIGQNNLLINIATLHTGIYLLRIDDGVNSHIQRLVIQ